MADNWLRWFPPSGFYTAFPAKQLVRTQGACSKGCSCPWEGHCTASQPANPALVPTGPLAPHRPPPGPACPGQPPSPPCSRHSIVLPLDSRAGACWVAAPGSPRPLEGKDTSGERSPFCHQVAPLAQDNPGLSRVAGGDGVVPLVQDQGSGACHLRTSSDEPSGRCLSLLGTQSYQGAEPKKALAHGVHGINTEK